MKVLEEARYPIAAEAVADIKDILTPGWRDDWMARWTYNDVE